MTTARLDPTDRRLIAALRRAPRAPVAELARRLSVTRGTVQTRLRRLEESGVVGGYGPDVDPVAAGFDVRAFTTLIISQGAHGRVVASLSAISEVMGVHTVTGRGDMLLELMATSNDHLHDVLQRVAATPEESLASRQDTRRVRSHPESGPPAPTTDPHIMTVTPL